MNWNMISDGLPEEKEEVLLRWAVPDMPSISVLDECFTNPLMAILLSGNSSWIAAMPAR